MGLWNGPLIEITLRVDKWYEDNLLTKSRGEKERERLSRVRARTRRRVTSRPSSGKDLNVTRFTQVLRAKGYITWLQRASSSGITPLRSARLCIPYAVRKKASKLSLWCIRIWTFTSAARRYTMVPQQLCITTESFLLRSQCMPLSENCDKRKLKWLLLPRCNAPRALLPCAHIVAQHRFSSHGVEKPTMMINDHVRSQRWNKYVTLCVLVEK